MSLEEDFLLQDIDDEKTVEFIKKYLPQELKSRFNDDQLYYFLDVMVDYYTTSGCLEVQPDEEGYITIDEEELVNYIVKEAEKDEIGTFTAEEISWVVKGEMEYSNTLEE
jgi:hypothetical protein